MSKSSGHFSTQSMQWLRFAGRYLVEIVLILSALWAIIQRFGSVAPQVSIALTVFLATTIFAIYRIRTSVEETDKSRKELVEAVATLDQDVRILLIEYSSQYLQTAFKDIKKPKEPHLYAGHELAKNIYSYARSLVTALKSHRERQSPTMRIDERFVINDFLISVLNSLPSRSYWLGVTHLTTGWASDSDPGFNELVLAMQNRSARHEVTILRIYCVSSLHSIEPISSHLKEGLEAEIYIKILTGDQFPPDMSVLWGPLEKPVDVTGAARPANSLGDASAICGMRFDTRHGRSLDSLTLCSPDSEDFRSLRLEFDKYWSLAKTYVPG